jgi:outer membrane lipoprotein LolB
MTMKINWTVLILVLIFATGCSTTPPPQAPNIPSEVAEILEWETEGRVGIRTQDDALSGNFYWHKTPNAFELNIVGPFGQGATTLSGNDHSVTLKTDDRSVTGNDAETLLFNELGWHFPIRQVNYWIRGLAHPTSPADIVYRADGKLIEKLVQDGWTVTYRDYTELEHLSLPQRLQVERAPYRVNLIITQWTVK